MIRPLVLALVCLILATAPVGAGDLVVIDSTAPELRPGQVVKSGAGIDVPAGLRVTLIDETGKPVSIVGPHSGPPPSTGGTGKSDGKLISSLANFLVGAGKETGSLGVMRAGVNPKPPDDQWVINISRAGEHCVPADGPFRLWRAGSAKRSSIKLRNLTDKSNKTVPWPAGKKSIDWPSGLALSDGGTYLIRLKGSMVARRIVIHLVPAGLPSAAHRAAWMAERGCTAQARAVLAGLK